VCACVRIIRLEVEKRRQAREAYQGNHRQTKLDVFLRASKGASKGGAHPAKASQPADGLPLRPDQVSI